MSVSHSPSLPPLHHLFFKSHQDGTLPLRHCSLAFRAMPVKRDAVTDDEVPYSSFSLSLCRHNSKTNRCQRGASWVLSEEDLSTHKGTFIGLPSISGDQREQEQTPESSDRWWSYRRGRGWGDSLVTSSVASCQELWHFTIGCWATLRGTEQGRVCQSPLFNTVGVYFLFCH